MKWRSSWSLVGALGLCLGAGVAINACAATKPHEGFGSGGSSSGTAANGPGGAGGGTAAEASVGSFDPVTAGSGGGACGQTDPNADTDMDGFTFAQGDCDDCDPSINPDSIEVIADILPDGGILIPADEDCDMMVDNVTPPCDTGLVQNSIDPIDGAKAIGICDSKFLLSAKWVQADGSPPPAAPQSLANFHLGHGILDNFGQMNLPREGVRLLALSSGTARKKGDPEFIHRNFDKGYTSNHPVGFPKESASCPGVMTLQPHDATGLQVELKAPSNALSFSFDFNFFTYEWPGFICSQFNDFFLANLEPFPSMQTDGNISFDSMSNPISVNNAFLAACGCVGGPPCNVPPTAPTKMFTCALGTAPLVGTDFDKDETNVGWSHGSTTWLQTTANVTGGDIYKLRFVTYDSSDGNLDSLTIVDNFKWYAKPGMPGTMIVPN